MSCSTTSGMQIKNILLAFFAVTLLSGGIVSWFASKNPDGLEWSIAKITGKEEIEGGKTGVHAALARVQEKLAFLPNYSFKKSELAKKKEAKPAERLIDFEQRAIETKEEPKVESDRIGNSVSGLIGGLITLAMAFGIGFALKGRAGGQ